MKPFPSPKGVYRLWEYLVSVFTAGQTVEKDGTAKLYASFTKVSKRMAKYDEYVEERAARTTTGVREDADRTERGTETQGDRGREKGKEGAGKGKQKAEEKEVEEKRGKVESEKVQEVKVVKKMGDHNI